jgi:ABC-type transport system involved in multi-copper enzyme maturation permease subunit
VGKSYIIATTTVKEIVRRPVFWLVVFAAAALLMLSSLVPYFTLGEDIKMVKDQGLAILVIAGLILALFAASVSIADEIDGKTAITLLSKPINRRQFIVGKFAGIMLAILLLFIILTLVFFGTLWYKAGFEARENAAENPSREERFEMMWQMAPGVVLSYFQVTVLCALSVAFSTRLPIYWNITICIALYLLGNLTPYMVAYASQNQQMEAVQFLARVFGIAFPNIGYFGVGPAIATDAVVTWFPYVTLCFVYCVLYTSFALVLAFLLFEDRDLA